MKLNDGIDKLFLLREQKRGLEAQLKEVNSNIQVRTEELLGRLKDVGTTSARGSMASVTVTETVVPQIENWGEVQEYIMANDALYLVHRRVSAGPWRELLDTGEIVPGIIPYNKIGLSLRRLND